MKHLRIAALALSLSSCTGVEWPKYVECADVADISASVMQALLSGGREAWLDLAREQGPDVAACGARNLVDDLTAPRGEALSEQEQRALALAREALEDSGVEFR